MALAAAQAAWLGRGISSRLPETSAPARPRFARGLVRALDRASRRWRPQPDLHADAGLRWRGRARSSMRISTGCAARRSCGNIGWDEAVNDAIAVVEWADRSRRHRYRPNGSKSTLRRSTAVSGPALSRCGVSARAAARCPGASRRRRVTARPAPAGRREARVPDWRRLRPAPMSA